MSYLVTVVQFFGSCVQHKWLLKGPVNEYQLINMYNLKNLCLDDQIIPEVIGAPFFSPCCIWCIIRYWRNFLFDSNPPFSHRHYYERIENAYMNLFITFFFNLLARNPLVWWIHVFGNLDILVFFSYIHILQLHWDGVHFQLNIPNLYGLKGYFHFF